MAAWSDDVTLAATIVALATGVAAVWTGAKARWRKTLGSRRILAAQLNRLAAGTSLEYLTALLGVPAMRHNEENGLVVHIYATRHAWIEVRLEPGTGTVIGFAITVTDRKFNFSVETLTFGQFSIQLGKSMFSEIADDEWGSPNSVRWSLGARSILYAEHYYRGNPGGYQNYVFAFNQLGVGACGMDAAHYPSYEDGNFTEPPTAPSSRPDWSAARSKTTINTLQVLGPTFPAQCRLPMPGPHPDIVRLLHTPHS
jgi:hypothetical protein